jgi:hypothetical protein
MLQNVVLTLQQSAISVFINNIAVLAIENCLLKNLSAIFSPTMTADMDDEQLHAIAAESEDAREERLLLKSKLDALKSGKQILYEHIGECIQQSDMKTRPDSCNSNEAFGSGKDINARCPADCQEYTAIYTKSSENRPVQ